jgi:hypothetical protein
MRARLPLRALARRFKIFESVDLGKSIPEASLDCERPRVCARLGYLADGRSDQSRELLAGWILCHPKCCRLQERFLLACSTHRHNSAT